MLDADSCLDPGGACELLRRPRFGGGRFESVKSERESPPPKSSLPRKDGILGVFFFCSPSFVSCNSNWLPKSGNGEMVCRTSPLLRHARPCSELRTNELSLSGILAGRVSERWRGIPRQPIVILSTSPKYCLLLCLQIPECSRPVPLSDPLVHFCENFTTTRSRPQEGRFSCTNIDMKTAAASRTLPRWAAHALPAGLSMVRACRWCELGRSSERPRYSVCGWRHTARAKSCMVLFVSKMLLAFAGGLGGCDGCGGDDSSMEIPLRLPNSPSPSPPSPPATLRRQLSHFGGGRETWKAYCVVVALRHHAQR
jgi:hypothetical protein